MFDFTEKHKGFWEQLTPLIQRVYHMETERPRFDYLVLPKREPLTYAHQLKKILNTTMNFKHKNGRIHTRREDGKYVSHTVSPYSKSFLENIEEDIQELVKALVRKNYITISSCASHSLYDKRYVAICFSDLGKANSFARKCKEKLKSCTIKIFKAENFLNAKGTVTEYGIMERLTKIDEPENSKEQVSDYLKALCFRYSEDWWILELSIISELRQASWWEVTKRFFYKKLFLKRDTKKLTELVSKMEKSK